MSQQEAVDIVDMVIEKLHDWGVIQEKQYGEFRMESRDKLADLIKAQSEQ